MLIEHAVPAARPTKLRQVTDGTSLSFHTLLSASHIAMVLQMLGVRMARPPGRSVGEWKKDLKASGYYTMAGEAGALTRDRTRTIIVPGTWYRPCHHIR